MSFKAPLLVTFLCASLTGCGLTSLFDPDDEPDNGGNPPGEAPAYLGVYAGSMTVSDLRTGDTWPDRATTMEVTFDELTGKIDLSISISGLPAGAKQIDMNGCSPGPTTVFCSNVVGSTLYDVELSFTSSSVAGNILESERQPDGTFVAAFEAEGTLAEQ